MKDANVVNHWGLRKAIQDAYVGSSNDAKEKTKRGFAPSQVGYGHGRCPRYWYLAFGGATWEEKQTAQSIANMENGKLAHERIQAMFEKAEDIEVVDIERELLVEDPPIFAFIDLIVKFLSGEYVGEIKTSNSKKFYQIVKDGDIPDYHLIQLLLYMHFTEIKQGFLYYENKDTLDFQIIPVEYKDYEERILGVIDWMKEVRANWESRESEYGNLPVRPWTRSKGGCRFCPLKKDCFDERPDGNITINPLVF